MRIKQIGFLCLATMLIVLGCKKKMEEEVNSLSKPIESSAIFSRDIATLSNRIDSKQRGVLELKNANKNGRMAATIVSNPYPLTLIGSVNTPTINGNTTVASTIAVNGNLAYVGYRRKLGHFAGAIDIVDVSNPSNPIIVNSVTLTHTDVHCVKLNGNRLYFSGATNISENRTLTSSGVFGFFNLTGGGLFTGTSETFSLPIDVAYDLDTYQDRVFIVGGYTQYTGNTDSRFIEFSVPLNRVTTTIGAGSNLYDLRAIEVKKTGYPYMTIYSGRDGIHKYDAIQLNQQTFFPQTKDSLEWSGRGMVYVNENVLAASGKYGLRFLDGNTYNQLDKIQLPQNVIGVNYNDLACFDVSYNGYILSAMGGAGLYVSTLNGNTLNLLGSYDFPGEVVYSVSSNANYIFLATNNGVKVLDITIAAQTPSICTGVQAYVGGIDYVLQPGNTASYGGAVGHQTMHIGGNYVHCGNVSVSKNFTLTSNSAAHIRGNLTQGFTNSGFYLSVENNSTLKVEGNLTIYGDLMLEGNIEFVGSGRILTVFGTVFRSAGAQILGSPSITGNVSPSPAFNTRIPLVTVNNIPNTAQGINVYDGTTMPTNTYLEFAAIFPRNVNYNDTLEISENGTYKFKVLYPHEYRGGALRFLKSNGVLETLSFPVRPVSMPVNPVQDTFFKSFRHTRNVSL
jgi:hypothetical protein